MWNLNEQTNKTESYRFREQIGGCQREWEGEQKEMKEIKRYKLTVAK